MFWLKRVRDDELRAFAVCELDKADVEEDEDDELEDNDIGDGENEGIDIGVFKLDVFDCTVWLEDDGGVLLGVFVEVLDDVCVNILNIFGTNRLIFCLTDVSGVSTYLEIECCLDLDEVVLLLSLGDLGGVKLVMIIALSSVLDGFEFSSETSKLLLFESITGVFGFRIL